MRTSRTSTCAPSSTPKRSASAWGPAGRSNEARDETRARFRHLLKEARTCGLFFRGNLLAPSPQQERGAHQPPGGTRMKKLLVIASVLVVSACATANAPRDTPRAQAAGTHYCWKERL